MIRITLGSVIFWCTGFSSKNVVLNHFFLCFQYHHHDVVFEFVSSLCTFDLFRNGTGRRGVDGRGQCVLHVELFPTPQITFVVLVESNFFHRHHVQVRRGVDVAGGP